MVPSALTAALPRPISGTSILWVSCRSASVKAGVSLSGASWAFMTASMPCATGSSFVPWSVTVTVLGVRGAVVVRHRVGEAVGGGLTFAEPREPAHIVVGEGAVRVGPDHADGPVLVGRHRVGVAPVEVVKEGRERHVARAEGRAPPGPHGAGERLGDRGVVPAGDLDRDGLRRRAAVDVGDRHVVGLGQGLAFGEIVDLPLLQLERPADRAGAEAVGELRQVAGADVAVPVRVDREPGRSLRSASWNPKAPETRWMAPSPSGWSSFRVSSDICATAGSGSSNRTGAFSPVTVTVTVAVEVCPAALRIV